MHHQASKILAGQKKKKRGTKADNEVQIWSKGKTKGVAIVYMLL